MTGIGISRSVKTLAITGLRKNFVARDGGIEEPYWGPSRREERDREKMPKRESAWQVFL